MNPTGSVWFGPADAEAVEILHLFGPHGDQAVVRTAPTASAEGRPRSQTGPS